MKNHWLERFCPYFLMGFISILLQVTAIRELLTQFSGNELIIGITISMWLIIVGAGSLIGSRLKKDLLGHSFILLAVFIEPTIFFMRSIRQVVFLTAGETISLQSTIIFSFISLSLLCFIVGMQFPLAVRRVKSAGTLYAIEALGAFVGGLAFTYLMSNMVSSMTTAFSLSAISIMLASYLLRKRSILLFILLPLAFHIIMSKAIDPHILQRSQSRYGEIWVTRFKEQFNIYSAGHFAFSYPDTQTEELKSHLPMSLHLAPEEVLLIGGSVGTLREFLKYPIKKIDFLEIDPELIKVSNLLLNDDDRQVIMDKRVRIIAQDGRRFIKSRLSVYDEVILNLSPPSNANINRFYTTEFFIEVSHILKKGGILFMTLPTSSGYIGKSMQMANGSIYNSLKEVFKYVVVTGEEYGGLFASMSPIEASPEVVKSRFNERGVNTKYFSNYIFDDALSALRTEYHRKRLEGAGLLNKDLRPIAYLYNLMLWASASNGRFLSQVLRLSLGKIMLSIGVALTIILIALIRRRTHTLYYSMLTTGYYGMSVSLCILLGFQSSTGYVYEMLGLLMASFMAGIPIGATLSKGIKDPIKGLLLLELGSVLFSLALPLFFIAEALYYLLSLIAGVITGCGFRLLSLSLNKEGQELIGGRLYAIDLMGSFIGALLSAIIFIPLLGIKGSLLIVALIKATSAILVAFIIYEKN